MTSAPESVPAEASNRMVPAPRPGLPRGLVVLLGAASAVVVAAGLSAVAWLVGPLFLALVIVITLYPVQARLRGVGVPGWVATTLLVLLVYAVLLVLAAVIVVSIARLATVLPMYAREANTLVAGATAVLAQFGVGGGELAAIASSLNVGKLVTLVTTLLLGVTGLLGNLVFLLSLLLFLSIDAPAIGTRMQLLARDHAPTAAALADFARKTRRYVAVNTVSGCSPARSTWWSCGRWGYRWPRCGDCWSSSPTTSPTSGSGSVSHRPRCSPCSSGGGRCWLPCSVSSPSSTSC